MRLPQGDVFASLRPGFVGSAMHRPLEDVELCERRDGATPSFSMFREIEVVLAYLLIPIKNLSVLSLDLSLSTWSVMLLCELIGSGRLSAQRRKTKAKEAGHRRFELLAATPHACSYRLSSLD